MEGTYRVEDAFAPAGAVRAIGALLERAVHARAYERRQEHRDAQCVPRRVDGASGACWVSRNWRGGARSGERREDDAGRDYGYGGLCRKKGEGRRGRRGEISVSIRGGAPLEGREKGEGEVQFVAACIACP